MNGMWCHLVGAISSIICGNCLPKRYHVLTQVSFAAASGDQFYNHKYTKPIEILPFAKRNSFFAYDSSGEDLLLGTYFLSLIALFEMQVMQLKRGVNWDFKTYVKQFAQ